MKTNPVSRRPTMPRGMRIRFFVLLAALAMGMPLGSPAASAAIVSTDYFSETVSNPGNGPVVKAATIHNLLVACPKGNCWGTIGSAIVPDQVIDDFNASTYMHVLDQYVGSTANGRYPRGVGAHVSYTFGANKQVTVADIQKILQSAIQAIGTGNVGYSHIYMIYIPSGLTVCPASGACTAGSFGDCGTHGAATLTFKGVMTHVLYAAIPYEDAGSCVVTGGISEVNDSMANGMLRVLANTIVDPDFNGWKNTISLDLLNVEMADECWLYHPTQPLLFLNKNPYKAQYLYSNARHACVGAP